MTEPKLSDKQRDEPFLPGTYGWIEQAVEFMQAFKPENFDPDLNRLRDDLLSGVPCPPKDLGFNSPADHRARRLLAAWNAATLPESGLRSPELIAALRARCPGNGAPGDADDEFVCECQSYEAHEQGAPCPPGCCVMADPKDMRSVMDAIGQEDAPAEGPTLEGADLIARLRGAPKEGNTLLHLEAANWIETLERENLELRHEG